MELREISAESTGQNRPLKMDEVSTRTGVPVDTLRYWRHIGTGPRSYKLGRRVVYDIADVEAWMAHQRAAGERQGATA